jgi:hypothetical protein
MSPFQALDNAVRDAMEAVGTLASRGLNSKSGVLLYGALDRNVTISEARE